jgi:hypothetical protein
MVLHEISYAGVSCIVGSEISCGCMLEDDYGIGLDEDAIVD